MESNFNLRRLGYDSGALVSCVAEKSGRREIASGVNRNFAAVLDDLFAASEPVEDQGRKPSIPFDYLAVADELHSGRIKVSGEAFGVEQREYREATLDPASEFAVILDQAEQAARKAEENLPPADPVAIAAELRLDGTSTIADFSRLRRSFAFSNHPDRVAPHLRQRAIERMQIANMLIDDARRKALAAAKR